MDYTSITKRSFNLKNLYFDPNNYRFIDNKEYKKVLKDDALDEKVQKKTRGFIEGEKRKNISDLISSFKSNGYVPVEKIQVKDLGENRYLVLEGNRRTAALKALQEDYEDNKDIGKLDPGIFKKVDVEVHEEENEQTHLLVMGLKHIGGNKKWPAINQAKFIKDYIKKFDGEHYEAEKSACETLGISMQKLRSSLRALGLIEQYQESDFSDQFKNEMFSFFEEIIKSPDIKEWIGWDDTSHKATNNINKERIFNWLSIVEEYDDEKDETKELEPIITKSSEIRQLKIFVREESAIRIMEESRSFTKGLLSSGNREKINLQEAFENAKNNISYLYDYRTAFDMDMKREVENLFDTLSLVVPKKSTIETIEEHNRSICFEMGINSHFTSISIESYKIFQNFSIDKLNRINIFAGLNNTGKTSLLEAIYLLTKQNDLNAFFEMVRLKNKLSSLNPVWIEKTLHNTQIKIAGIFNGIQTEVEIEKFEEKKIEKSEYITSLKLSSKIDDEKLNVTKADLYKYTPISLYYEQIKVLCASMFKSPFFYKESDLVASHKKSVEKKVFHEVIDFLKKVDTNINDIDLTEEYGIKRFLVDSSIFKDKRVDITSYGEGIQRIFEISLSFAYAKNGVVLIDEIETGIHHSLLIQFTSFIQELAVKFNVQVFITSHSKECIDAFVYNGVANEDISAFHLINIDDKIKYKYSDGKRLEKLVENLDFDMRGDTQ